MRRSVLSGTLAASLFLFACSEQPTEAPPTSQDVEAPSNLVVCSASGIQGQITALFPAGGLLTSAQAQFSSIPKAVDKESGTAARDKTILFVDFLLDTYYAGQLTGGLSPATFNGVIDLIQSLYCFARLAAPSLPAATSTDVVVTMVFPDDPTITIVTPSEHAALTIPEGATPVPTLIAVSLLPDAPPPLRTSLDQYPFFYHFSGTTATGPVTFNLDVITGVCLRDDIDVPDANLRLAHNVAPFGFGDVEILPRPTSVPGLDCTDLPFGPIGSIRMWGREGFAWAQKLFLPAELHAASLALETAGVGGTTKKFSEFGVVDITSNPGSFSPESPASANEEGGATVTRTALVTSDNGTPIHRVPVTFATDDGTLVGGSPQTVLTGEDGQASVSWILPSTSGDHTLDAQVPAQDNPPFETTDPPGANIASFPDVAFTPQSLTFTATIPNPQPVTPVSSSLQLIASSNAGGVLVEDTDAANQGATLNQLSATVSAFAENGSMSVLTKGSAVATWLSGGAGQIVFTEVGWTTAGAQNPSHAVMFNGTDWTYTFTANESGTFRLDYDITLDPATTDEFGLQGFTFSWAQGAGQLQQEQILPVTAQGTLTKSVVAGTTYTVRIDNRANIFGPLGSRTAYMSGTFDWSVTTTPPVLALSRSARSASAVGAPLTTARLVCDGTQRRICTQTYQARKPAAEGSVP